MRVVFLCEENACRSQLAEALAKRMFTDVGTEFASAGTHPAPEVDHRVLKVLQEEGINWQGRPKSLDQIGKPDIVVTMGCDVVCPYIPGVKTIEWDLPNPRGKPIEKYRQLKRIIKDRLLELREFNF